ncbi:3-oxoadipate enol-lactonase [Streptacidiphilus sp. N1-10]|uniref:3-oxoadipate enol-lactonase n=1 Tax=Streptacidiphilus jeojiensis TaxID=3229225 RepID=A0ABV6XPZ1_9ACTN
MTTPLLHHRSDGASGAPALLLGPSLGTSLALWDAQAAALARDFHVVRWDLPGHGGSAADLVSDGATVADLGRLVLDLADALGLERFSYAGVSLGGAVGSWLAAEHPERVGALALICTSAHFGGAEPWRERAAFVRAGGDRAMAELAGSAPARWFTDGFVPPDRLIHDQRTADPAAYAACCDALAAFDLRGSLARITAPALVLAGREDCAAPPSHSRELADGIAGSTLLELPAAAHLAPVEQPGAVLHALRTHFLSDRHAAGMSVRRAVLGDAHVDRAVARTTPFTADFQDFITRYAWGEIWTRPGLDRRTRSCITLTALVAGGHHNELAMHVRAALRNGLTPDEIKEVLLQSAVYCGVPAANSAFAVADAVLQEEATP